MPSVLTHFLQEKDHDTIMQSWIILKRDTYSKENVSNGPMQILLPQTKLSISGGRPVPATIAFKLANVDEWIVGVLDGRYLKMVKLKVTGENSYNHIETKYNQDGMYDESQCVSSFSESCFVHRSGFDDFFMFNEKS